MHFRQMGVLLGVCVAFAGCSTVVESNKKEPGWEWHCEANTEGGWDCQWVLRGSEPPPVIAAVGSADAGLVTEQYVQPETLQPETLQPEALPLEETSPPEKVEPETVQPVVSEPKQEVAGPVDQVQSVERFSSGFVLQLVAVSDEAAVQRFINEHALADQQALSQQVIFSRGKYWHVLIADGYGTRAEAVTASDDLQQNHPGLEPWVRSARSLQQAIEAAR